MALEAREPVMQEQPVCGACEGELAQSDDEHYELERTTSTVSTSSADKRKSLRHIAKSVKLEAKNLDDKDDQDQMKDKRRQMRKDLHKLKKVMARTGAAAVAASIFTGGQTDGVSSMDQASRFRRQHRPPIPELFPDLYNNEDPDYDALASTKPMYTRPYRDWVLDEGGAIDLSGASVTSSLSLDDWDKLSDMGSEAGGSVCGSDILFDWEGKNDMDNQQDPFAEGCSFGITTNQMDCGLDFIDCLDSGSRFRRPKLFQPRRKARSDRHMLKATTAIGRFGAFDTPGSHETDVADVNGADRKSEGQLFDQDGLPTPIPEIGRFATTASALLVTARGASSWVAVKCRAGISTLATVLGDAPQHVAGNFASPSEIMLAVRSAMAGDDEERYAAKIFLCCTLGLLVLFTLSCLCLTLVVLAFVAGPESFDDEEQRTDDTGMIDSLGRPKSISRVLTVVMISLFAGNGLAISHPMRDALLCGI